MANNNSHPESNTLGLAGFIVSLVGWVTCGLLCPVGTLLCLFAMKRRPRGFAVAGLIVGGIGSALLLLFVLAFFVLPLVGLTLPAVEHARQTGNILMAEVMIEDIYDDTGALPSDDQMAQELSQRGRTSDDIRYEKLSETTYKLTVPGLDQQFGTSDDDHRDGDVSKWSSQGTP